MGTVYPPPQVDCEKKLNEYICTDNAQCRSALSNLYECDNCNFCSDATIPYAGGLAWTSAGQGAIECTTTSGKPVACVDGRCSFSALPDFIDGDIYETYAGVIESDNKSFN